MSRLRVVGLTKQVSDVTDVYVGLEVARDTGEFHVAEVFEALQQYLDLHRDELRRLGSEHVCVSMVRSVSPGGAAMWSAAERRARPVDAPAQIGAA